MQAISPETHPVTDARRGALTPRRCVAVAVSGLIALSAAAPGGAGAHATAAEPASAGAAKGKTAPWTMQADVSLSPRKLGLRASASPKALARAAIDRLAPQLGLRSVEGLRLTGQSGSQPAAGGSPVNVVSFNQTAGGLRVVWSEIEVIVAAGKVSSLNSTVVPARTKLTGRRQVSRKRALTIASRAVGDPALTVAPEPVAYAGDPRVGKWDPRQARRAWLVRVDRPLAGEDMSEGFCVVVDAQTGKVLAKWRGTAARTERTADGVGALATPSASAQASAIASMLHVYKSTAIAAGRLYARFLTDGPPRASSSWPSLEEVQFFNAAGQLTTNPADRIPVLDTLAMNSANVARTVCQTHNYCGARGGFGGIYAWDVIGNSHDQNSRAFQSTLVVSIGEDDVVGINGFNDVVAHEFGHVMDWVHAGDRNSDRTDVLEVQEALADMAAYDYDRGDATLAEETAGGVVRNWATPSALSLFGQRYPTVGSEYYCGSRPPHLNSTILSHAYYRFVQDPAVGHARAGSLLGHVSLTLPPAPSFTNVGNAFVQLAGDLYRTDSSDADTVPEVREAAQQAFGQVGPGLSKCVVGTFPKLVVKKKLVLSR